MAETGPGASGGYVAFISYSHKDAAMGRWLHRKLEGYRLPRRLAGTQGEDGEVPERLTPIFRDRDELPAAGDLSEKVRAALAVSRNLIVLCSPHSASSPWVAREIATFRELHPDRPILTAIVDGEPGQCFPPALLKGGVEPLAADLRTAADGPRLGLLKLVAGLAGVGLDALVQRDAARRVQRVSYITATALAAMLAMAVMTTVALTARAEAQLQRSEAEGLVEFMLTDLRDRLKGVGRLDVMSAVNGRALAYYGAQQELDDLGDQSLGRRARVLQAIGDDNLELDDHGSALKAFEEAETTTTELVDRAPRDPQRLFEHTKSLYGIGRVHELRGDWQVAHRRYLALAVAAERLRAMSPSNPDYLMKAASAAVNLGNLTFKLADTFPLKEQYGRYAEAARYYGKAVHLLDRVVEARPDDPHALMAQSNALAWLADSYYMRDRWHESLEARRRQYQIMATLHGTDTANSDYSFHLAVAQFGTARSLVKLGRLDEARVHLFEADRLTRELVLRDSCNEEWRSFRLKLDKNFLSLGLGLPPGTTWSQLRTRYGEAEGATHPPSSMAPECSSKLWSRGGTHDK